LDAEFDGAHGGGGAAAFDVVRALFGVVSILQHILGTLWHFETWWLKHLRSVRIRALFYLTFTTPSLRVCPYHLRHTRYHIKALHLHAAPKLLRRKIEEAKSIPHEEEVSRVHQIRRPQLREIVPIETIIERPQQIARGRNISMQTEPHALLRPTTAVIARRRRSFRNRDTSLFVPIRDGVPARTKTEIALQADDPVLNADIRHVIAEERQSGLVSAPHAGDVEFDRGRAVGTQDAVSECVAGAEEVRGHSRGVQDQAVGVRERVGGGVGVVIPFPLRSEGGAGEIVQAVEGGCGEVDWWLGVGVREGDAVVGGEAGPAVGVEVDWC